MKLKKAIEILQQYVRDEEVDDLVDLRDAIKLGTEALKRHQTVKSLPYPIISDPLPGEN